MKKFWLNWGQLWEEIHLKNQFIDKIKIMDEMMIDQTPLADRFVKKYNRKFEKSKNNITKTIKWESTFTPIIKTSRRQKTVKYTTEKEISH